MLKIYICDDEKAQRDIILSFLNIPKDNICVRGCFDNPHKLLSAIGHPSENDIGLYFIDIDLKCDMDGFELASEIRKKDLLGFIVIITTHSEMLPRTFEYMIEPLKYIIKSSKYTMKEQVHSCLDYALNKYNTLNSNPYSRRLINLSSGNKEYFIPVMDIIYITMSSLSHTIEVATVNSILQFRNSLSGIYDKLPKSFILVSRDTLINTQKISAFDKANCSVTLSNGVSFTCSKSRIKSLQKILGKDYESL